MATVPAIAEPVAPTSPKPDYQPSADSLNAFGGIQAKALQAAGPELQKASDAMGDIALTKQRQAAAVAFSNAVNAFKADPTIAPERAVANGQVNGQNLTDIGTDAQGTGSALSNYTDNSQAKANAAADAFGNQFGAAWGGKLAATLQEIHNGNVTNVGAQARGAQNAQVGAVADQNMQPILAAAYQGDTPLPTLLSNAADQAELVANGNGPAAGVAAHNKYINQTLASTFQGQITRATSQEDLDMVRKNLSDNKGLFTDAGTAISLQQDLVAKQTKLAELVKGTASDPNSPLNIVTANLGALGHGTLPPQKEAQVLMLMQQISKPYQDPVTKTMTPGLDLSTLPGFSTVKQQWEAAHPGFLLPGTTNDAPTNSNPSSPYGANVPAVASPGPASTPAPTNPAAPKNYVPGQPDPARNGGQPTLWNLNEAHQLTGTLNAAQRLVHGTEIIGNLVGGGPTVAKDAVDGFITQAQEALATTNIPGSNRTNEGQLKDVAPLLDKLRPGMAESEANWNSNAIAIDDVLSKAQAQAVADGRNKSLPPDVQGQARLRATSLQNLREQLGAPLRIDEARAKYPNPPRGMPYRKPDDTIGYAAGAKR